MNSERKEPKNHLKGRRKNPEFTDPPPRSYERSLKLHLNTSFDIAMEVCAGHKKPKSNMIKLS